MYRGLVIDDEQGGRTTLKNFLSKYCPTIDIIGEADSVKTGKYAIEAFKPDVVFLDVQMQDGTGFDLLESLEYRDFYVIFVTAYDQYAIKAFKFSALDYILKPIDPEELMHAVSKLEDESTNSSINKKLEVLIGNKNDIDRIALPSVEGIHLVKIKDIVHCQAENNYTTFYLISNEKILVTKTLKEYESILSPFNFFRIHQSHLINIAFVEKYIKGDGGSVVMENGKEIEIARRRKDKFLSILLNN